VDSQQTAAFFEHFHHTVKKEFFSVVYRKELYRTVQDLQQDLEVFVRFSEMSTRSH
jgi:hypothetical protein